MFGTVQSETYFILLLELVELRRPEDGGNGHGRIGGGRRVEGLDEEGVGVAHLWPRKGVVTSVV